MWNKNISKYSKRRYRCFYAYSKDLSPKVNVPVEVVPMEELEKVLSNSNNGTIVTSRYFLQPLENIAKQHEFELLQLT